MAAAGGGAGLSGRRPALPLADGAVEALPRPTLLPLAVQPLVGVQGGGTSINPLAFIIDEGSDLRQLQEKQP